MAKITLEYDLETEREMYEAALNGWRYKEQIEQIWQECFRPLHKHGYTEFELANLCKDTNVKNAIELVGQIYCRVVADE